MKKPGVNAQRLQSLAYSVLRVTGTNIFIFLTGASLIFSQYMLPKAQELPLNRWDKPFSNILAAGILFLVIALIRLLERRLSVSGIKRAETAFLVISMLWAGFWGFWWISSLDRLPEGDQP